MATLKDFANTLGVAMFEQFYIKNLPNRVYRVEEEKIVCKRSDEEDWYEVNSDFVYNMLKDNKEIVIIPYKPKEHSLYFYVQINGEVYNTRWEGDLMDYLNFFAGNCFNGRERAELEKDNILKKILIKDDSNES